MVMKKMMMMVMVMMVMMMMSSVRAETSCSWLRKESTNSQSMFHLWSNRTMSTLRTLGNSTAGLEVSLSSFPERQYDLASQLTGEQKVVFLAEVLGEVSKISVAWSSNISSSLEERVERFNSDLYRQSTELHNCVKLLKASSSSSSSSSSDSVTKLMKKIKIHLKALKRNLNQQDDLRSSLFLHLVRLDLLASSISL